MRTVEGKHHLPGGANQNLAASIDTIRMAIKSGRTVLAEEEEIPINK
jgi:hypothetical protein